MNSDVIKHQEIELLLNNLEFKKIKLGSLLAQTLEMNY